MVDRLSAKRRSWNMSRVRSKNTTPEMRVRSLLHRMGYRFRLHLKDLPGNPDIVLPKYRTAIFIHGCFWHRHSGCSRTSTPTTNPEFWDQKFRGNVNRDRKNAKKLAEHGWKVVVVWECETRNTDELAGLLSSLFREGIDHA